MKDSMEKTEHYIVVKASSHRLDVSEANHQLHLVQTEKKDNEIKYVLLDLQGVELFDEDCFEPLLKIQILCAETLSLLVCFNGKEEWMDMFADNGIVLVPTKHEAIEYVYMDQLEKQFLADEE
jgi:hypothetical protein